MRKTTKRQKMPDETFDEIVRNAIDFAKRSVRELSRSPKYSIARELAGGRHHEDRAVGLRPVGIITTYLTLRLVVISGFLNIYLARSH